MCVEPQRYRLHETLSEGSQVFLGNDATVRQDVRPFDTGKQEPVSKPGGDFDVGQVLA